MFVGVGINGYICYICRMNNNICSSLQTTTGDTLPRSVYFSGGTNIHLQNLLPVRLKPIVADSYSRPVFAEGKL